MRALRMKAPTFRLVTVLGFVFACAVFFAYMWSQAGGTVPGFSRYRPYHVSVVVNDVDNMVPFSDVQVAGINVGKVASVTPEKGAVRLDLRLDDVARPLHEGATVQVSEKSLAGQSYLHLVDGKGRPYPNGGELPRSAVKPSVQLRDVLASLDPRTRDELGATVRSLGQGTDGSHQDVSKLMDGMAKLGRNGHTALDAISAQTGDMTALAGELNTVLKAVDTGHGQVAQVVTDADRLSAATAGQREAVEGTMRKLPGTLNSVHGAATKFTELGGNLSPVASDLRQSAPGLSESLQQLPATTADLRGLMPDLNRSLDKAPTTLQGVPPVGNDAQALLPQAHSVLQDLNPMLRYLRPYGRDIAEFFPNFGSAFHHYTETGDSYLQLKPELGPYSVRGNPLPLDNGSKGPLRQSNPYPAPGELDHLKPFVGEYPRIKRDPQ